MPVRPQKRARGSECSGARLLSKNPRKQQHIIYQKAKAHKIQLTNLAKKSDRILAKKLP